jgi:hypothetical protein
MNSLKYLVGKGAQILFTYLIWFAVGVFNLAFVCRYFILEIISKIKSQTGNLVKATSEEPTGKGVTEW